VLHSQIALQLARQKLSVYPAHSASRATFGCCIEQLTFCAARPNTSHPAHSATCELTRFLRTQNWPSSATTCNQHAATSGCQNLHETHLLISLSGSLQSEAIFALWAASRFSWPDQAIFRLVVNNGTINQSFSIGNHFTAVWNRTLSATTGIDQPTQTIDSLTNEQTLCKLTTTRESLRFYILIKPLSTLCSLCYRILNKLKYSTYVSLKLLRRKRTTCLLQTRSNPNRWRIHESFQQMHMIESFNVMITRFEILHQSPRPNNRIKLRALTMCSPRSFRT
jgi:hypothetical protein